MKNLKYFREILIVAALAAVLIAISVARYYVASYYDEGKGFEWDATASTTIGLPLMFAKCDFHYTGNYSNSCERSVMLYGDSTDHWITCGGSGIGESRELYPNNLEVLYYSFSENKFYGGIYKLDYQKILSVAEKMRKAVQTEDNGRTESISFRINVYPNGKIVFSMESYISTSVGEVVIATFQAKPENHDWSVFENSGDDRSGKGGIGKSTSVEVQRALLLNKYNWQIQVLLPKECRIKDIDVDVYGNKRVEMDTIKNTKIPAYGNFVYLPKELSINWQRKDSIEFHTYFHFNEQEIIKAFETTKNVDNLPIMMQLIIKDDTTSLRAVLNGNGKNIELKDDNPSKIYSEEIYHYPEQ